eukprot:gnl/TRDRNA2_/TRDRNA2_176250_c1_seq12.p1 gnl/TRDRNA2_/TRDRNA2_176250_c1~~gnl/TRDRNA2_/TRDRNA2_176250_c1_seq12.p1  ORF type:complete len:169 (+),score=10.74 gnl/TRDRNA2_/TRDRNA2_176250_c1_seq12:58-564(+)
MPRRRSSSRSDSRRRSKRKSRKDSRSRSRSRTTSRRRDRGRSGDRGGRGGKGKGRGKEENVENLKKLPEWGSQGVIQSLKPGGIGFIRPESGTIDGKDLFFHKSALLNGEFDYLTIGEPCTYVAVLIEAKNQPAAKNITLTNASSRGDSTERRRRSSSRGDSRERRRR